MSKVKKWLASQAGDERSVGDGRGHRDRRHHERGAREWRAAAPEPIAQNELVKALTGMGYKATDATRDAMHPVLQRAVSTVTGGGLLKPVSDAQAAAMWEMNQQVAKQVLKGLSRKR